MSLSNTDFALDIKSILQALKEKGIHLSLDGNNIKYKAPAGHMTADVLDLIRTHKAAIISFLENVNTNSDHEMPDLMISSDKVSTFLATPIQKQLWYIDKCQNKSEHYNIYIKITIEGVIDSEKIKASCQKLLDRHELLRAGFFEDGNNLCVRIHEQVPVHYSMRLRDDFVDDYPEVFFDLNNAPQAQFCLVFDAPDRADLYIVCHHIVCDGQSMNLLYKDFVDIYCGNCLSVISTSFHDYTTSYYKFMQMEAAQKQLMYWTNLLSGELPVLALPTKVKRAITPGNDGGNVYIDIDFETSQAISHYLKTSSKTTTFSLFLSIYMMLLHRYTNQNDIIIGIPFDTRFDSSMSNITGMFVNGLPIRQKFTTKMKAVDVIDAVSKQVISASACKMTPLGDIIKSLNLSRNAQSTPIFQSMFMMDGVFNDVINEGFRFSCASVDADIAKFDLSLSVRESGKKYNCVFEYDNQLLDSKRVFQIAKHYKKLVQSILLNPNKEISSYNLLTEDEQSELIFSYNKTKVPFNQAITIHELFEQMVDQNPKNIAAQCDGVAMDYNELNCQANKLADYLIRQGVKQGERVAVLIDRSIEAPIAFLAILKIGAVFVPLDLSYPQARLQYIIDDADCQAIISKKSLLSLLGSNAVETICLDREASCIQACSNLGPMCQVKMDDLAYIIYTSGSTGKPKGVMIHHLGISHYIQWACKYYRVKDGSGAPVHSSLAFDLTITSIFAPLACGKTVFMIPDCYGLEGLISALRERQDYSLIKLTPAHIRLLQNELSDDVIRNLHAAIVIGGEALYFEDLQRWYHLGCQMRFINEYGATETSVADTVYELGDYIPKTASIPVGKAIDNSQMYVLDAYGYPVPYGVIGEIFLSGVGLAKGYLNLPDKTKEKFLPHPFISGETIYKTGDYGRIWDDGQVEFVARVDDQVKIKGYRVELGEIQKTIDSQTEIDKSIVTVHQKDGENCLVAYYLTNNDSIQSVQLRERLRETLPTYMIPLCFIRLDRLPLTINGKVDLDNLPKPTSEDYTLKSEYQAPVNEKEALLTTLWMNLFGLNEVSVHDNFYALGGDSISCIRLLSQLRQSGWCATVQDVLRYQTIQELASVIQKLATTPTVNDKPEGVCPLSPIQAWFVQQNFKDCHHFNQSYVFKLSAKIRLEKLNSAFAMIQNHHDAFWLRLTATNQQCYLDRAERSLAKIQAHSCPKAILSEQIIWMESIINVAQINLDISTGPLTAMLLFDACEDGQQRLVWIIHHWIVDAVSWHILIDDLTALIEERSIAAKTDSYQAWAKVMHQHRNHLAEEKVFWSALLQSKSNSIGSSFHATARNQYLLTTIVLKANQSEQLVKISQHLAEAKLDRLILTIAFSMVADLLKIPTLVLDVESHGREGLHKLNLTNTVGWFTSMYPILFKHLETPLATLKNLNLFFKQVPHAGIGYGILRHLENDTSWPTIPFGFNFLGDQTYRSHNLLTLSNEFNLDEISMHQKPWHVLDINAWVESDQIHFQIGYHPDLLTTKQQQALTTLLLNSCDHLIRDISEAIDSSALVPRLHEHNQSYALPSTSTQAMMYQATVQIDPTNYLTQIILDYEDGAINIFNIWQKLVDQYPVLGSLFASDEQGYVTQSIGQAKHFSQASFDWSNMSCDMAKKKLNNYLACDMQKGFDESDGSALMRITKVQLPNYKYLCIWTHHHMLLDGWSAMKIVENWKSLMAGCHVSGKVDHSYESYIRWRELNKEEHDAVYWVNRLQNVTLPKPTTNYPINSGEFKQYKKNIGSVLTQQIQAFCSNNKMTQNVLFQFVWGLVWIAYTNQECVIHDMISSGRGQNYPEITEVVGFTMSILPFVNHIDKSKSINELLLSMQKYLYEDILHDQITWSDIEKKIDIKPGLSESLFVYENYHTDTEEAIQQIQCNSKTHYPLVIAVLPGKDTVLACDYRSTCFSKKQVATFISAFECALAYIVQSSKTICAQDVIDRVLQHVVTLTDFHDQLCIQLSREICTDKENIILLHPGSSGAEAYMSFHQKLLDEFNVYAIDSYNKMTHTWLLSTIKNMANVYNMVIPPLTSDQPINLLGWSLGGVIAYEMMQQRRQQGKPIGKLFMLDSFCFLQDRQWAVADALVQLMRYHLQQCDWFVDLPESEQSHLYRVSFLESHAIAAYKPEKFEGQVVLFKAKKAREIKTPSNNHELAMFAHAMLSLKANGWLSFIKHLHVVEIDAGHYDILQGQSANLVSKYIKEER